MNGESLPIHKAVARRQAIGDGVDSGIFNPETMETYTAQVDRTLTIVKEKSPTSLEVEQTVQTKQSAKQMVWGSKTKRMLPTAADYTAPATLGAEAKWCRIRSPFWW